MWRLAQDIMGSDHAREQLGETVHHFYNGDVATKLRRGSKIPTVYSVTECHARFSET